jgi:DMSO/TMAO reductase YedYZ molybdopterin-dependent catalytic subunit/Ni,Fe-hydrogenase I cytochrome b subunit
MDTFSIGDPSVNITPMFVRLTHWFNVLFLTMVLRSGLAILAAHPKLYWNAHSLPGSEWLRFTRKRMPSDRLWTSTDEEEEWPGWLSLPGGLALGLGRYWHFLNALCWMACGAIYVVLLFLSPQWRRLVPTSWEVIPDAIRDMGMYLTFRTPPPGTPYGPSPFNPLQQLTYFGVVFFLAPFMILTGLAQSPSITGRFPWYQRLFGNRQAARSLHFLGLVDFLGFLVIHLVMVFWHGFAKEMNVMVMGREDGGAYWWEGAVIGVGIIAAIVLVHVAANLVSERFRRATHKILAMVVDPFREGFLHRLHSVQDYAASAISPFFRTNGYPPISAYPRAMGDDRTYERLMADGFADYRLRVGGLVDRPMELSLDQLRTLPRQEQTTLHQCIQGWTSIGRWGGVRLREVLDRCGVRPEARYLVFQSFSMHETSGKPYYESVSLDLADHPQTILAYELNGVPLPVQHGAPVRPRIETKLGFKMVKFLRSIEVVDDYRQFGDGRGGVREDEQQFDSGAEI